MTQSTDKVVVIDPRSQPPAVIQRSMAPRLGSLKGKTIYVVDINWPFTRQFTEQLHQVFTERYPDTKFVFKDKAGSYFADDPRLWQEIKENGDGMILSVGH
jgi:hypothetical protein